MKFRTLMYITAITVFAALATPARLAAQHTESGTNGRIAFTQGDQNGIASTSIVTAIPDGLQQKQLPLPDGIGVEFFSGAVWSPDGSKLLISHTVRLDSTVSEASRSGYLSAMPQAILPPQSWPTR